MTHTTPTLAALYAAVLAAPDEDTPRLAYADALQEHADDTNDPEPAARAELVRVQVELAGLPGCLTPSIGGVIEGKPAPCYMCRPRQKRDCAPWCENCCKREDTMTRLSELFTTYSARWETLPCVACAASGWVKDTVNPLYQPCQRMHCPVCRGTGDLLIRESTAYEHIVSTQRRRVHWERGFPEWVESNASEVWQEETVRCFQCHGFCPANQEPVNRGDRWVWNCNECRGEGTVTRTVPTPWARAIARYAVGIRVRGFSTPVSFGSRRRWRWPLSTEGWRWPLSTEGRLPVEVDKVIPAEGFSSSEAAERALWRAVGMWARSHI